MRRSYWRQWSPRIGKTFLPHPMKTANKIPLHESSFNCTESVSGAFPGAPRGAKPLFFGERGASRPSLPGRSSRLYAPRLASIPFASGRNRPKAFDLAPPQAAKPILRIHGRIAMPRTRRSLLLIFSFQRGDRFFHQGDRAVQVGRAFAKCFKMLRCTLIGLNAIEPEPRNRLDRSGDRHRSGAAIRIPFLFPQRN